MKPRDGVFGIDRHLESRERARQHAQVSALLQQRKHHGRIEHGLLSEGKDDGLFGRIDLADADGGALDAQTVNSQKRLCGRHGHPKAIR